MIIESLKLVNWRGYQNLNLTFNPKINVIEGKNGSGKSNLAEAIYYLSLTRSWRTNDSTLLIQKGSEEAYVSAVIKKGIFKKNVEIQLKKGQKKVQINSKPIKGLTELSNTVNIIVFSPSDVPLFLESPSLRRNFLDIAISKVNPEYLSNLTNYNTLINQRNTLLKNETVDLDLLSVLTSQLVREGVKITKERNEYIKEINSILPKLMSELLDREVNACLVYHPFIDIDDQMEKNASFKFKKAQDNDLRVQFTTVGPQKEDFDFLLDGLDVSSYGSQGQNRLSVLALKLAPYFLIKEESEKPVVVLDDVMSELDKYNQKNLIKFINNLSQVFITTTNLRVKGASLIDVTSNIASRRK